LRRFRAIAFFFYPAHFPQLVLQFANPLLKLPHLRADPKFDAVIMLDPGVSLGEQAFDLFNIGCRDDAPRLDLRRQRALNVERPVLGDDLLLGSGLGVKIDR
jgi:hypothetical protein